MRSANDQALPKLLRAINLDPAAMDFLPVPPDVNAMSQVSEIDVCRTGLRDLPIPLEPLADWICCFQAAPHNDPAWKGSVFVTLAVNAQHCFETMVSPGLVVSVPVGPGTLLVLDPLLLHWLKPESPLQDTGFAAIQWSIDRNDFTRQYRLIRKGLQALGLIRSRMVDVMDEGWRVSIPAKALSQ
ncbi:hypothetical protein [Pseudomonas sp. NPDC089569]|uniref:hypothetical protein n=1 Tax=Pseudomonas sp. NPDC089569 TaxID=3390722 RepID=UPI003D027A8F